MAMIEKATPAELARIDQGMHVMSAMSRNKSWGLAYMRSEAVVMTPFNQEDAWGPAALYGMRITEQPCQTHDKLESNRNHEGTTWCPGSRWQRVPTKCCTQLSSNDTYFESRRWSIESLVFNDQPWLPSDIQEVCRSPAKCSWLSEIERM